MIKLDKVKGGAGESSGMNQKACRALQVPSALSLPLVAHIRGFALLSCRTVPAAAQVHPACLPTARPCITSDCGNVAQTDPGLSLLSCASQDASLNGHSGPGVCAVSLRKGECGRGVCPLTVTPHFEEFSSPHNPGSGGLEVLVAKEFACTRDHGQDSFN